MDFVAALVLLIVAVWCVLSPRYEDGIIGKLMFSLMALSCYAILVSFPDKPSQAAHNVMTLSVAACAARELFIKRIWPWMRTHK
jgi:hypothetical protein